MLDIKQDKFLSALVLLAMFWTCEAHAQQRTFFNSGFEQNDPQGPGNPDFEFFDDDDVPEWISTTNEIELWDSGFLGVDSYEGNVHAEMNARMPGQLFQEICLIGGEDINWSFAHRAREGGADTQVAILDIRDLSGALVQNLGTQNTTVEDEWQINTGTITFSGTTGIYRAQFRTTNGGSLGNFLDAIVFNISSFAVLTAEIGSSLEASGNNIPRIAVNGLVEEDTTIPVNITGGTATLGDDFVQTSTTVLIPEGLYFNEEFDLPITINDNLTVEPDETIIFELGTPSTQEVIFENTACDGTPPQLTATYTILNDDTTVTANKTVVAFNDGTDEDYSIPGNDVVYTISVNNTGPIAVDDGSIFLVDSLPAEISFFNGDIDGPDLPETEAVIFNSSTTSPTFDIATDLGFSENSTPPADMSECTDTAAAGYNDNIRHICFAPQGPLPPNEGFTFSFRTGIK